MGLVRGGARPPGKYPHREVAPHHAHHGCRQPFQRDPLLGRSEAKELGLICLVCHGLAPQLLGLLLGDKRAMLGPCQGRVTLLELRREELQLSFVAVLVSAELVGQGLDLGQAGSGSAQPLEWGLIGANRKVAWDCMSSIEASAVSARSNAESLAIREPWSFSWSSVIESANKPWFIGSSSHRLMGATKTWSCDRVRGGWFHTEYLLPRLASSIASCICP